MRKTHEHAMIDRNFDHHPPPDQHVAKLHGEVRARCKEVAQHIERNLPDSRERSLAMTKLEEAMMWANAAIARELSAPRMGMMAPMTRMGGTDDDLEG